MHGVFSTAAGGERAPEAAAAFSAVPGLWRVVRGRGEIVVQPEVPAGMGMDGPGAPEGCGDCGARGHVRVRGVRMLAYGAVRRGGERCVDGRPYEA